uniref:Uncharacterized protein n=1 Tax=Clastoptera arizonana TaxID=38151 RepID=A0A1B6D5B7_9HEMI
MTHPTSEMMILLSFLVLSVANNLVSTAEVNAPAPRSTNLTALQTNLPADKQLSWNTQPSLKMKILLPVFILCMVYYLVSTSPMGQVVEPSSPQDVRNTTPKLHILKLERQIVFKPVIPKLFNGTSYILP